LVRKEEMGDINKMLNTLGYKAEPLYKWCLHNSYCVNYYHINKVRLQIHWELFSPDRFSQPIQPLPNKILWENAIPIDQENIRAHILSNETNVVYMCLHAAKHSREGIALLKFLDIALFLKKNGTSEGFKTRNINVSYSTNFKGVFRYRYFIVKRY